VIDRGRLDAARTLIDGGALAEASALLVTLRKASPDDVNVLNLSAMCALRAGALDEADALSATALAKAPGQRMLIANRCLVWRHCALSMAASGDHDGAAQQLHAALALDSGNQESRSQLLRLAVDTATRVGAPGEARTFTRPPKLPSLSFITCSIDRQKQARFEANLAQHFADWPHELLVIRDARSLAEAYNRGIDQTTGEWIVFCHDDIEFVQADAPWRLFSALSRVSLVGVAGTTHLSGPTSLWSGPSSGYCQVAHVTPEGQLMSSLYGLGDGLVANAEALDGVFLACHRSVAETIRFDADTFDHFHLYDTDFSWRAHRAGFPVGISQDLLLIHHSLGSFDETWQRYADRFRSKHPEVPATPAHPSRVVMTPNTRYHLVATHDWLARWRAQSQTTTQES